MKAFSVSVSSLSLQNHPVLLWQVGEALLLGKGDWQIATTVIVTSVTLGYGCLHFLKPNPSTSHQRECWIWFLFLLMVGCQFWHRYIKCFKLSINRGSLISACFQCNTKVMISTGLCVCGIECNFFPSCCYSWSSRLSTLVHFHSNFVPVLFFILFPFLLGPSKQIPNSALLNKFLAGDTKIRGIPE